MEARREYIEVSPINLGDIPCFYIKPFFNDENKTIFYYHGWSSNKGNGLFIGKILAFHGYNVIIPDAIHHGERNALKEYNVGAMRRYFWNVIFNSVSEYKRIISGAVSALELERDKVAVMGSSMGGFIASGVFADNKEIKCLINMNGACAWEKAESMFKEIDREGKGAATAEQKKLIIKYDPLEKKNELYPRAILMLHGDADTSVYIDIQRYFYDEVKDIYKDKPERLVLAESPKLNHYKTTGMLEESIRWLEKYL